jgi:hypothetical protein
MGQRCPHDFVIPGRSDAKRSADPGIHAATVARCRGAGSFAPKERGRSKRPLFSTVAFFGQYHGMDPRVCAASLRSLLRPWMTKLGSSRQLSAPPRHANKNSPFRPLSGKSIPKKAMDSKTPSTVLQHKYSILIDMRELESAMSGHHITMIARGMDRLSPSRQSMPTTSGPGGPFCHPTALKGHFCAFEGTRSG